MTLNLFQEWQPGQAVWACAVIGGDVVKKPCIIVENNALGILVMLEMNPDCTQWFDANGRSGEGRNAAWLERKA